MNFHPYDGKERRYRHTDSDQVDGLTAVKQVLRLAKPPSPNGLLYDLSFFSGGIGVLDHLAISLPADATLWATLSSEFKAATPEEAGTHPTWAEELFWLLSGGLETLPAREAAVRFINDHRRDFQTECVPSAQILFGWESDVNHWDVLWRDERSLNYIGYDQG